MHHAIADILSVHAAALAENRTKALARSRRCMDQRNRTNAGDAASSNRAAGRRRERAERCSVAEHAEGLAIAVIVPRSAQACQIVIAVGELIHAVSSIHGRLLAMRKPAT